MHGRLAHPAAFDSPCRLLTLPMRLIIQPEDGVVPIVAAIRAARKSIDMPIFRLDHIEVDKAIRSQFSQYFPNPEALKKRIRSVAAEKEKSILTV